MKDLVTMLNVDPQAGRDHGNEVPRFMSARQLAAALDVSAVTIYKWERYGKLRAHRIGGLLRFAVQDVRMFLAQAAGSPRRIAPAGLLTAGRRPRGRRPPMKGAP